MEHGEILVQISLAGEPQKLLTYWRGSLRHCLPIAASVTILRPSCGSRRWWDFNDPNFHFKSMTRTEKKRAELSISEKSLMMQPQEIAIARELTEQFFGWLSGRREIPAINRPIPAAEVSLSAEGGPDLVDVVELFNDPRYYGVRKLASFICKVIHDDPMFGGFQGWTAQTRPSLYKNCSLVRGLWQRDKLRRHAP